jgi:hypothetical protein
VLLFFCAFSGRLRPWDKRLRRSMVQKDLELRTCSGCVAHRLPISKSGLLDAFRNQALTP